MPRGLFGPVASRPARRSLALGLITGLVAGTLLVAAGSVAVAIATAGTIMPGVSVAGVDVGGLDRASAEARLEAQLPSLQSGSATLEVGNITEVIGYDELGRDYEYALMVDAAYAVARTGDPLAEALDRLRALVHPISLPAIVKPYDAVALGRVAITLSERAGIEPMDAHVERRAGRYQVVPGRIGLELDPGLVRAALAGFLATDDPSDFSATLEATAVHPAISDKDAKRASLAGELTVAPLTLGIPGERADEERDPALLLDSATIAEWVTFGPTDEAEYGVILDEAAVAAAVEALVEVVDQEPVNASFSVAGSGLGGVVPGQDGRSLNVEGSVSALLATLEERASGRGRASALLDVSVVEAELSTAEAEAAFPQMQMVSSWTTNYVPGISNGWGVNISIPAWDLDGYTMAPGEWFSFWEGIGPVTTERGYTQGGAIINGRSQPTGALAGGICSTSTTLFNAAMRFGLEIGDRAAHYYYIDRYPVGLDATVSIIDGYVQDMTFRNDTEHPVVIRGFGSPGRVTFQIWGVPNGRTVALSAPYTANYRGAVDTTVDDPSLPPGTSVRDESPHDGFQATVSRTVYDASGEILHQNTWFSDYRAVNGVVRVGPGASAEGAADTGTSAGGGVGGDGGDGDDAP